MSEARPWLTGLNRNSTKDDSTVNSFTGSWGLLAALISIGNLHLHLMHKHGRLHAVHSERSLVALVFLGIGLVVGSGIGNTFLLLAQSTHLFLRTRVWPHTPTDGGARIFFPNSYAATGN